MRISMLIRSPGDSSAALGAGARDARSAHRPPRPRPLVGVGVVFVGGAFVGAVVVVGAVVAGAAVAGAAGEVTASARIGSRASSVRLISERNVLRSLTSSGRSRGGRLNK